MALYAIIVRYTRILDDNFAYSNYKKKKYEFVDVITSSLFIFNI